MEKILSDSLQEFYILGGAGILPSTVFCQWLILVPLIGGRYHIISQLAAYTTYIPLIYCQLGDYMLPTTY